MSGNPDQKCLNISSLQTEYLNLDNSVSGSSRHNERAQSFQTKCIFFGLNNHYAEKCFKRIRQEKEKAHAVGISSNINSERPPRKCYRCGSEDHMIAKYTKPSKDSEKQRKSVCFNEKGNHACENSKDNDDHKIYASMAQMSLDVQRKSEKYGDSSQLTNWILDSVATCHMTPDVSDFIPGSLEDTYIYIEVADGHHVTAKQKGQVRIQMCDDNGNTFIATLYNVLLAPDLCNRLFSIITLMNAAHTSCRPT